MEKSKGITLIALVITIIVLLILAGVSIAMLTGENGILTQANRAKTETEYAGAKEKVQISIIGSYDDKGKLSLEKLKTEVANQGGTLIGEEFPVTVIIGAYEFIVEETGEEKPATGGVSPIEIFDKEGKDETKLHIGDFINYDAGTWTRAEIEEIKVGETGNEVPANNSNKAPTKMYEFGGFEEGSSRNGNVTPSNSKYTYIKDTKGQAVTGWRVFDVEEDGTVTLISAGDTENYYHGGETNYGYKSAYILSGEENDYSRGLTKRNWKHYINKEQHAISATALTKEKLESWYNEYMGVTNADIWDNTIFQKVYGTKYETMIDNYSNWWIASVSPYNDVSMCYVYPNNQHVNNARYNTFRCTTISFSKL